MPIPALTAKQMGRVDRIMVQEFGLHIEQLMELAGWAVASFARARLLATSPRGRRVLVVAGKGGNGGDGLVAARLLHGWGAEVEVILSHPPAALNDITRHQARIVRAVGIPLRHVTGEVEAIPPVDLVIDALLGFGGTGPPTGDTARLMTAINASEAPVLAVDLPSGLEATTGEPFAPCVRASATLTLALPKTGLLAPRAAKFVGDLWVADIGVPEAAYARAGLTVGPIFSTESLVPIPRDFP